MLALMPTVTVVIPVLDDAEMLRHCLDALAAQIVVPDSVLVVDNGCTDDSVEVARRTGACVVREPRHGILPATARGFDTARADILARIDADSRPEPDWLLRVMKHFEGAAPTDAVTGPGRFYGGRPAVQRWGERLYLGGYFRWMGLLLGHPPLYGSNFAIRRAMWEQISDRVHRTDPRLHDDLDLSFHLPPAASVQFDPELVMPVSARPFATVSQTARRVGWGFRTIWVNAKEQNLWRRRQAVRGLRRAR